MFTILILIVAVSALLGLIGSSYYLKESNREFDAMWLTMPRGIGIVFIIITTIILVYQVNDDAYDHTTTKPIEPIERINVKIENGDTVIHDTTYIYSFPKNF